ncbi:MAG: hypothetical protein GY832_37790, partial [Chloroflexi bacterium]|nr:hypothetical protein [Chloroflexota bacterium]
QQLDDYLSKDDKAAIEEAEGTPDGQNPFVTRKQLDRVALTDAQKDAIQAAKEPSGTNPFITQSALPDYEDELTPPQKAALDAAHSPGADNPLATLADLGQAGIISLVVAAGTLDLGQIDSTKTLGGLKVVDRQPGFGLATLSFENYTPDRKDNYIVQALPVNDQVDTIPQDFNLVQFIRFGDQGFTLQMAQPLARTFNLGRCMVEVSEIIETETPYLSLQEAIKLYYELIQQERIEALVKKISELETTSVHKSQTSVEARLQEQVHTMAKQITELDVTAKIEQRQRTLLEQKLKSTNEEKARVFNSLMSKVTGGKPGSGSSTLIPDPSISQTPFPESSATSLGLALSSQTERPL